MTFDEGRALFPVLEHVAYLNAGTFGPLARPTGEAIADQLRRDLEHGRSGKPYIEQMQAARAKLRGLFAALKTQPDLPVLADCSPRWSALVRSTVR